jgi:hypothetical protein
MIELATDTATTTSAALYWVWRGDLDQARVEVAKLSTVDRYEARMVVLRLAALLAVSVDCPSLPAGVEGHSIGGRVM